MTKNHYDVIIVGGGISGAALFYTLQRYTNIKKIALFEKYEGIAKLNSKCTCNSQTIHYGDIETNYVLEKAKSVNKRAKMIVKYNLQHGYENKVLFSHQKMAFGVGEKEVSFLKQRYEEFKEEFPYLVVYDKEKLKQIEPSLIKGLDGNDRIENVIGVGAQNEWTTVDYGAMAESFVANAIKDEKKETDVFLNTKVESIQQLGDMHHIYTADHQNFTADFVVVDAGAHSLYLAHKMDHGTYYSCLPVAGSFYMTTKKLLNGKVYGVQHPKLPFAALHGDPDIFLGGNTRFGPTALMLPKLERYRGNWKNFIEFVQTLRFDHNVAKALWDLISDKDIGTYIFKNFFFEVPYINRNLFVKDARKIVPSLKYADVVYAKNFGGVRPQIIDKRERKLMMGEATVNPGTGIIFNMTPSPGATSCLGNALKDAKEVCKHINKEFDETKFTQELIE